jgi:hypothetical protein
VIEKHQEKDPLTSGAKSPGRRQRILKFAYRFVIILGLVSFVVDFVLTLFSSWIPFWTIAIPVLVIFVGVILAWVEYTLHKRQFD